MMQPNQLYTNRFERDDISRIHYYTFYGRAGETVNIRMAQVSYHTDSFIQLYAPDGQLLAEDDNSAGSPFSEYDAELDDITLSEDGFYLR